MGDKHKKRVQITWKDWSLWWFSLLAGIINVAIVVPNMPWRFAGQSSYFGSDFVSSRSISLLSVTDNFGQWLLWFKLKKIMCQKATEVSAPSLTGLVKKASRFALSSTSSWVSNSTVEAGGSVMGCDAWSECQNAANQRCTSYGSIAVLGVAAVLFILASLISLGVCLIFVSKEEAIKKKKKKETAEFNTAVASACSFFFTFFGGSVWCFGSDSIFKGFQLHSFYPYPAASVGYYMVWFVFILTFVAMICGWRRQYKHEKEDKDSDDEEEWGEEEWGEEQYPQYPAYAGAPPLPLAGGAGVDLPPPPTVEGEEKHDHHKHKHKY